MKKTMGSALAVIVDGKDFFYLKTMPSFKFTSDKDEILQQLFETRNQAQKFLDDNVNNDDVYDAIRDSVEKDRLRTYYRNLPLGLLREIVQVVDFEVNTNT